jgi:hypothetical protein
MRNRLVLAVLATAAATACGTSQEPPSGRDEIPAVAEAATGETTPSPQECPPNWPGPWTACPEARWVRQVAERAGYRVVAETGSALVAEGEGRSFYIWATELAGKELSATAKREEWHPLGVVEGVEVFGDEREWRWWSAQGFVFWLHAGPLEDATIPELREMAALVRTSQELPPPNKNGPFRRR